MDGGGQTLKYMDLHICLVFPDTLFSDRDSVYSRGNMFEILETPEKTCLIGTVTATTTRLTHKNTPQKQKGAWTLLPLQPMSFPAKIRVFPPKHVFSQLNTRIPTMIMCKKHVCPHLNTKNAS